MSKNINSILERIIQVQIQTINKINSLSINYQLPSSVVQLNQLGKIPEECLSEYTAFEVFAHDYDIPVGECTELGGYVNNAIPASLKHKMKIGTNQINEEMSDVIIDWGDGNYSKISNGDYVSSDLNAEDMECDYIVEHDYKETGKYIIRIYGKQYYNIQGLSNADPDRFKFNLICRAFSHDLPISKNLTNLAGFLKNSNHLLNVAIPSYLDLSHVTNYYSLFIECHNLLSVKGLKNKFINVRAANSIFYNCKSLNYLEYTLPSFTIEKVGITNSFYNINLNCDINDLMPDGGFIGLEYDVTRLFTNCKYLTGIVPANKLWNNKNINWILPTNEKLLPFYNCSDELRSQVPVSWGGTNKNIDCQLSITDQMKSDYTAFEVFAHDYDIPSGQICEELGGYVNNIISASMECRFVIRSEKTPNKQDTLIDWGDGSIDNISAYIEDTNDSDSEFISLLYHAYEKPGKYIIKIYGKDYFSFCQLYAYTKWKPLINSNILCRIFEKDLPIASHIKNLSSAAHSSLRLLNLNVWNSFDGMYMAYTFKNCSNLLTANGFSITRYPTSIYDTFNGCTSLTYSTLRLPAFNNDTTNVINGTYGFCKKLKMNVEDLLPPNGFFGKTINIQNTFVNCKLLGGTINSDYLWDNKSITFINTDKTFQGCSSSLRAQVPVSWGGTASDDIIQKSIKQKFDMSNQNLLALEQRILQLESKLN